MILGCSASYNDEGGHTDGPSQSAVSDLLEAFRAGEGVDLVPQPTPTTNGPPTNAATYPKDPWPCSTPTTMKDPAPPSPTATCRPRPPKNPPLSGAIFGGAGLSAPTPYSLHR